MKKRMISILATAGLVISLISVISVIAERLVWERYYSMLSVEPEKTEASSVDLFPRTDILSADEDGLPVLSPTRDVLHVLLIGVDDPPDTAACRSDAVVLLSVNRKSKRIVLCSFLRDLLVSVEGHGQTRLNSAYFYGKEELLCATLRQNYNLEIPYFITVDFRAFEGIIDGLGGVSVTLSPREASAVNRICNEEGTKPSLLPESEGTYRLNGAQALAFARDRGSATGDFDRTRHQRVLLSALFEERKGSSYISLLAAADEILPFISTNLSLEEVRSIVSTLPEWMEYPLVTVSVPGDGNFSFDTHRGMSVIRVDRTKVIADLHENLYQ